MIVSVICVTISAVLNWLFVIHFRLGHQYLALSTSITAALNFGLLFLAMRRYAKGLHDRELLSGLLKLSASALCMAGVCWLAHVTVLSGWSHYAFWLRVITLVQAAGDVVEIFGGAGGGQFLQELRRGSIGTMPFPSSARAFVEVWDAWHAGDVAGAREVFVSRILPLLSIQIGGLGGAHIVHKEALRRQGVIRTAHVRPPVEDLDPITREELEEVFAQLGWAG